MAATRSSRRATRRTARPRKVARRRPAKQLGKQVARPAGKSVEKAAGKPGSKFMPAPQVLLRFCRSGWAVIVDKIPNAQGTRFVCPFCPLSHRVSGPVRGFRKMRRPQWIKLRRVEE